MATSRKLEPGQVAAARWVAAVFCSVVGLQLGWLSTTLLGEWNVVPALLLAGGGIALGYWLGSRRNPFFDTGRGPG